MIKQIDTIKSYGIPTCSQGGAIAYLNERPKEHSEEYSRRIQELTETSEFKCEAEHCRYYYLYLVQEIIITHNRNEKPGIEEVADRAFLRASKFINENPYVFTK